MPFSFNETLPNMSLSSTSSSYQSCISNIPALSRYVIWALLFVVSLALFFFDLNRNSLFSIPIEVFSIILAATLVASSYILRLHNIWFKFMVWMAALGSTAPVAWLIMLYAAHPFGTETTIILYGLISSFLFWLFILRKKGK